MRDRRRRAAWVAVFSAACSLLLVAPSLLMRFERGFYRKHFPSYVATWTDDGSYSPLDTVSMGEDNYYYAARIRQAATHVRPGDPYIRENKSLRLALTDFLTFEAYALVLRLAGTPQRGWDLSQLLFSLLWVPALYLLLVELACPPGGALAAAVGLTLFADLARAVAFDRSFFAGLKASVNYAFWLLGSYSYFFGPTRITGPLLTYPALFFCALLFVRADERRSLRLGLAAGACGGALAFVHADVWLIFGAGAGLYTLARCAEERRVLVPLAAALAAALLVCAPWLLVKRPFLYDAQFLGLAYGRRVSTEAIPHVLAALGLLSWRLRRAGPRLALWLACALLAAAAFRNTQLVTGWTVNQGHWTFIGNLLTALAAAAFIVRRARPRDAAGLAVAGALCALSVPRALSYAAQHYQVCALPSAREEAFRWLEANTPKDSVVAALSPWTSLQLPVHTHNKTAYAFLFPVMSDISPEENASRVLYALSLTRVPLEDYLRAGLADGDFASGLWQGQRVDEAKREAGGELLLEFCQMEAPRALAYLRAAAARPVERFPVDYLWVGPFERALMKGRPPGRKVFGNGAIELYALGEPAPNRSSTR